MLTRFRIYKNLILSILPTPVSTCTLQTGFEIAMYVFTSALVLYTH